MNISEAEFVILDILWDHPPLTIGQIIARVPEAQQWHESTIKTMVARLTKKGHISRAKDGKQYFYQAVTKKSAVLADESKSFIHKFFAGNVGPLMAYFAKHKNLTAADIEQINQIIKELKDD
ncbi:BlaI/MecI/CopY family transcriptional regulator [Marinicella meishanensis]|uniref:BlaI/MecI/CopY family transcriptional regulator n=1 Tax=Marinicella meishanensis TaxID=2873263 RepID=UPI001CBE16F0|nr:BlaI/MecI/CopY family transcriptional regulator [Marinicella sp. NBU2979]